MTHPTPDGLSSGSSTGLAPNVAGALAYVLGPLTGILFFLIEKESRFVRFHAAQSITVSILLIALSIVLSILSTVLAFIPILGWIVALLLGLGLSLLCFVLWVALMWKAYSGAEWEVPIAGPLARRLMGEGDSAATLR